MIEIVSPATSSESMHGYNGWTVCDRSTLLETNRGAIEKIGCKLNTPGWWRPVIVRKLDARNGNEHQFAYRHPAMVYHPGDGNVQWISLASPVKLWSGFHYAGAYFTGFSSSATPMAMGRCEVNGDVSGINLSLYENAYQTPQMGIRYEGSTEQQRYFYDFDRLDNDGWQSNASNFGLVNFEFRSSGWTNDANHEDEAPDGLGRSLSLLAYRYFEIIKVGGGYYNPDFTSARIQARIRIDNLSAPQGTDLWLWMQGRNVSNPTKFANWALTGIPLTPCLDGQWHEIDVTLPSDPQQWTFGGGPSHLYLYQDLATTLQNMHDMLIVLARPTGSFNPSGTFRMDWVRVTYPS
jgi:hypothetical protein